MKYAGASCASSQPRALPRPRSSGNLQSQTQSRVMMYHPVSRTASALFITHNTHHHEVSVLGLVHHRFLPGGEVHRTLFTCLDFYLDAEDKLKKGFLDRSKYQVQSLKIYHKHTLTCPEPLWLRSVCSQWHRVWSKTHKSGRTALQGPPETITKSIKWNL